MKSAGEPARVLRWTRDRDRPETGRDIAEPSLAESDGSARTGCTVVAADRDRALLTEPDVVDRIQAGDLLIVAEPDDGIAAITVHETG